MFLDLLEMQPSSDSSADPTLAHITRRNWLTGAGMLAAMNVLAQPALGKTSHARATKPAMDRATFDLYLDLFNRRDVENAARRFFTDDIVLEFSGGPPMNGAAEFIKRYNKSHEGVSEVLVPQVVVIEGNYIAAFLEATFLAEKDMPYLTSGPLKAGEKTIRHALSLYTLRDGKFANIKVANWVAN